MKSICQISVATRHKKSNIPQRNYELLLSKRDYCQIHQHRCKNTVQHNACKWFWNFGTRRNLCVWHPALQSNCIRLVDYNVRKNLYWSKILPVTRAWTSSISFCFSSASKLLYHFASLVFPARFWISMNLIGIINAEKCNKYLNLLREEPKFVPVCE